MKVRKYLTEDTQVNSNPSFLVNTPEKTRLDMGNSTSFDKKSISRDHPIEK
jgi:hypothetical protein